MVSIETGSESRQTSNKQRDAQILRHLVRPEAQCMSSTLHDRVGAQSAENTGFVILAGVQIGKCGIVRSREASLAGRTRALIQRSTIETGMIATIKAEYVARYAKIEVRIGPAKVKRQRDTML